MVSARTPAATLPGMVRASVEAHLGSRQVARVVYGAIIGLTLIVALQGHPPPAGIMVGWLLGTALTVGLAEGYSDMLGIETSERHRVTRDQLAHLWQDAAAVGYGAGSPSVFFVAAAVGLYDVETAFTVATWSGLGLIGFYGYWAARFAGAGVGRALVHGTLVALVGGVLIVLKALLH